VSNPKHKTPPFAREMDFQYGVLERIAPGLRRIVCNNPSPFTFKGTNLYVIGEGSVAVVDPGPASGVQLDVLCDALQGETITHILVTHCHADHSGAADALKERTGAPTCGMPRGAGVPSASAKGPSGRSFVVPVGFDISLQHGAQIRGDGWELQAIHTPGHAPDHLCFYMPGENILFSGDHVMGWNTSVIAPPEGNMGDYMRSLDILIERKEAIYYPGHGAPIYEPQRFVKALIFHRRWREMEIIDALRAGLSTIGEMVPRIYSGLDPSLTGAATLSVFAHLEYMAEKGTVTALKPGPLTMDQAFALTEQRQASPQP
jgi:glyoxylase-like metal-dependent hydrolase (beta-lactamase superfamily II)